MDSDPQRVRSTRLRKLALLACALLLALSLATASHWLDSSRILFLCGLTAALALWGGARALTGMRLWPMAHAVEPHFGFSDDAKWMLKATQAHAQLEHVPVALWWRDGGDLVAINTAARRLLAPGAALDREQFLVDLGQRSVQPGRQLFSYASERGHERCLLASSSMTFDGREVSLLALMPIESELEAQTLLAWRQLVHVLTHEIMNSLTPIASLSRTAQELLGEAGSEKDLALALDTIARRAESLAGFVANYRHISEMPPPKPEPVLVEELFARLNQMVSADWRARGGSASFMVQPTTVTLMADPGQLEQAMLNLLKNAAQATHDVPQPTLSVSARLLRGGRLALEVRDNGPGVPIGMERDIFLPFVSASPVNATLPQGRGIGLAVVRNLVHGMGGTVRYVKPLDGGACFVLSW